MTHSPFVESKKLVCLTQFHPIEFSWWILWHLTVSLKLTFLDIRSNDDFLESNKISGLEKTKKDILVYLLMTLALILPVAIATTERAFSIMHIIKNRQCDQMGDEWINDCLVTYIEKDMFDNVNTETIMWRFQNMKTHQGQL